MSNPWAGGRGGYSNQGYQLDQQYEYEQCNNGNILLTDGVRDFYYTDREAPRLPARSREPPCGAIASTRFEELQPPAIVRHNKPALASPPNQGRFSPMASQANQGRFSPLASPTSGRRDARFSPVASPTFVRRDGRFSPPTSPFDMKGHHESRFSPVTSPTFERRLASPNFQRRDAPGPLASPSQARRQTIIVSPHRTPALRPRASHLDTSCYSDRVSFVSLSNASHCLDASIGSRLDCTYTPVKTSTPAKRRGDAVNLLATTSPTKRGLFQESCSRTAVIQPSIYKTTTTAHPDDGDGQSSRASWISGTPSFQKPPRTTLATAAFFLALCGSLTCALALYLLAGNGRKYYLDFGFLSGLSALLLGCLGFRARRWSWLPNRNYVSGYVMVSLFSLATVGCLTTLTLVRPRAGSPLNDLLGGAVCAVSALALLLAAVGLVTSHCCKYPPPDNRVEHGAEGFSL